MNILWLDPHFLILMGGKKKRLSFSIELCHRSPSAQLSDGLRAAAQCQLAPMCAALPAGGWLTCRIPWFHQCHLEALKKPTNLKRWILRKISNGMAQELTTNLDCAILWLHWPATAQASLFNSH